MNVEIGTEAAQFPEKEYIKGIFVAVWVTALYFHTQPMLLRLLFEQPWYYRVILGTRTYRVLYIANEA
jgi:hypothetical protein